MRPEDRIHFLTLVERAPPARAACARSIARVIERTLVRLIAGSLALSPAAAPSARAATPPSAAPEAIRELDGPMERPSDGPRDGPRAGPDERPSNEAERAPRALDKEWTTRAAPAPPPAPAEARAPAFLYRYGSSISPRVGAGWDAKEQADKQALLYLIGVHFEFAGSNDAVYEAGADAQSNGRGAAAFARFFRFGRGRTRPYAKAGAGIEIDPTDKLAGFLKYENFQLRGSGGLETTLHRQLSLRFELEVAAGVRTQRAALLAGYAYAW